MEHSSAQIRHVDLEAERAVLASVLLDNNTLPRIASIIDSADDFSEPSHATVWEAFLALMRELSPIDLTTTVGKLREMNRLNAVGGPQFLGELTDLIPTTAHCETHARIVEAAARARRFDLTLQRARNHLASGSPDDGIRRALECIADAKIVRRADEWKTLRHHAERAWAQICEGQDGRSTAIPTGLVGLDGDDERPGLLGGGLHVGELVVVAADQAGGKTTFALQALLHAAKRGFRVLLLSQEMNGSDIFTRFECSEARVPLERLRAGKLTSEELQSLQRATNSLVGLPIRICDNGRASVSDVHNAALVARARGGVGLVVVDYLQILEPPAGTRDARPHEIIDANTRALKVLAREISAPVLLLSQFNRASQAERRAPRIQDLKGSGGIESHADVVMVLHPVEGRHDGPAPDEVPTDLMVLKNRSGPTGSVRLVFERRHLRFREE